MASLPGGAAEIAGIPVDSKTATDDVWSSVAVLGSSDPTNVSLDARLMLETSAFPDQPPVRRIDCSST